MGMESFFIKILPDDAKIIHSQEAVHPFTGSSRIICSQKYLIQDWTNLFESHGYTVKNNKRCMVINGCIDVYVELTREEGGYLTLVGVFEQYGLCIKLMQEIILLVQKITKEQVKLFIAGEVVNFDLKSFQNEVMDKYSEQYLWYKTNLFNNGNKQKR